MGAIQGGGGLSNALGNPLASLNNQRAQQGIDQLRGYRQQFQELQYQESALQRERLDALMAMHAVDQLGITKANAERVVEAAKKPSHDINYDAELLPELRKWRKHWLKV